MHTAVRTKVSTGIRKDVHGYEAYVKVGGVQVGRRFPPSAPIRIIRVWREQARAKMVSKLPYEQAPHPIFKGIPPTLTKSPDGWCYIYVIQDGPTVKIGRAVNPKQRLAELQTSHHRKLTLVCVVPAHASLERAIHERFAHLQQAGEWFRLDTDLTWFIEELIAGKNPVALIW